MFSRGKGTKPPSRFKGRRQPKLAWTQPPINRRTYVFYESGGNMEVVLVKYILETFRKVARRRRYKLNFIARPSYMVFRKSKNSRMGKGKGRFKRWSFNFKKNHLFMVAAGLSHMRLVLFFKDVSKLLKLRFKVSRSRAGR